jgi:hypothetical protein
MLHLITLNNTHIHTRYGFSGGGIGPSQISLHCNTKYSEQKASMTPEGIAPAIPSSGQPQTHAFDSVNTRVIYELLSCGANFFRLHI